TTTTTNSTSQNPPGDEIFSYGLFLYDVDPDNDGYRIVDIDADAWTEAHFPRHIIVPQTINGKQVTAIGKEALAEIDISKVTLPEGLIDIYQKAFYRCRAEEINIPSTVRYIGGGAFQECYFLRSITVPEGVTMIYDNTFRCCTYLETLILPNTIEYVGFYAFSQLQTLTTLTLPKNCEVNETAFNYSPNLKVKYQ
ncbi:MAG: leucine-rich repeat domain-containing protein, partial [Clostridia bacterium]|nr:leucine-rich repeat domain-containing protein [Clostridia bacterium]